VKQHEVLFVVTTGGLKLPQLVMKAAAHPRNAARTPCSPRGSLFAAEIGGNDVDLQITDRVPGRVGVSFNQAEDVAIFIGGGVANVLLSRFTDDLYERVELWAIARFHKKEEANTGGPHSPRRSASTDQTTRYSKPGRSTTTAKPTMMLACKFDVRR